mgnify:CR=1 FL=1
MLYIFMIIARATAASAAANTITIKLKIWPSIFIPLNLEKATKLGQLYAYKHYGFWKSVDTQKDVKELSEILKNDKK